MDEDGRQEAFFPFDIGRLPSSSNQLRRPLSLRISSRFSTVSYGESQMKRLVRMNDGVIVDDERRTRRTMPRRRRSE